jgi:hypothetical protein
MIEKASLSELSCHSARFQTLLPLASGVKLIPKQLVNLECMLNHAFVIAAGERTLLHPKPTNNTRGGQ